MAKKKGNHTKLEELPFCPRCGSMNVRWVLPQMWFLWECQDCGYRGPLVIEDGEIRRAIRQGFQEMRGEKGVPEAED